MVKRFVAESRPMTICLVILSWLQAKEIFEVSELFYLKISVESLKTSGPSQCHICQRFGHGSQNCGNPPRCVKCAGAHKTNECVKNRDQASTCANCNGYCHTDNYRGCPQYTQVVNTLAKNIQISTEPLSTQIVPPTSSTTS